jgi:hypothetical protein
MAIINTGLTEQKSLTQDEKIRYILNGSGCPFPTCHGHPEEVYFTEELEVQGDGTATISKKCGACGRIWVETYRLVSIEEDEERECLANLLWDAFAPREEA